MLGSVQSEAMEWHDPPVSPYTIVMRLKKQLHAPEVEYVLRQGDLVQVKSSAMGKIYLEITPLVPKYEGPPFVTVGEDTMEYFEPTDETLTSAMRYGLL